MKPMLARTIGPKFDLFPCIVQPKLNGVRALYQNGVFQSRGEKLWKPTFFPHIVEQLNSLDLGNIILDGEFYVHGWKLQRINSAVGVNNNEPNEDTPKIIFNIFDVVNPREDFLPRIQTFLEKYYNKGDRKIYLVPLGLANNRAELDAYFHQFVGAGYEGLMARPEGPYEFGETPHGTQHRSRQLWKYKSWQDGEWICAGITHGEGKASIGIGALTLKTKEGLTFHVGTGFDDSERIKYLHSPPTGKLIRIRYLELSSAGIPLNPSFIAVMN